MSRPADDLRNAVQTAEPRLRAISESDSATKPAPGKWSPREILGHLIDSAANNHIRFVRGALEEDLLFSGYAQNEWVALQDYQNTSWSDLLDLWAKYNLQLSRVIAAIPGDAMKRPRSRHNFDQIAWSPVPTSQPSTLEYFVKDYIAHLEHHLKQIRAAKR